jgi:dihydroneopterin aldolase
MTITLNNIKLYAYHGCLEEEAVIGGNYSVDVIIHTDFSEAAKTDDLSKTVDYCDVYEIVKKEMAIRSKLIEHVAQRIGSSLLASIKNIQAAEIHLTKITPPMNGDVASVTVKLSVKR